MEGFRYHEITDIIENKKIPDIDLLPLTGDLTGKREGVDYLIFDIHGSSSKLIRPKQEIETILTDYVTNQIVAKYLDDPTQMNKYIRFLNLITKSFNKTINRYKKIKHISPSDIYFLYKGGCMLRIVYLRYKDAILKLNNALGKSFDQFDKFFKLSDADFTIIINPNLSDFENIKTEINILSFHLLCKIRDILENDIRTKSNYYLSSFSDPTEERIKQLDDLVMKIENTQLMKDKRNKKISYYTNSFEGDKIELLVFDDIHSTNNINLDDLVIYNARNELKTINTNNSFRNNGIIRKKTIDGNQKKIYFPDTGDNEENTRYLAYVTYNDTISFNNSASDVVDVPFNLLRIKLNVVGIFSEKVITTRYYKSNFGAELIDVTIPNITHHDLRTQFEHIDDIVVKYSGKNVLEDVEFYSYSIVHFYDDLYHILYELNIYPWLDDKYEKRIQRLFSLIMLILFDSGSNVSSLEFIIEIINTVITLYEKYESHIQYGNVEYIDYINKIRSFDLSKLKNDNHVHIIRSVCDFYLKMIQNLDNSNNLYDNGIIYTNEQGKKDLIKNKKYLYQPLIILSKFLEIIKMIVMSDLDGYISSITSLHTNTDDNKNIGFEHLGGSIRYINNKRNYIKLKKSLMD